MSEAVADASDVSWREVRQVLEEEMARLPDDLRSAVVVCLFEGHTQEEAGQILNVHPRTVKDRVRRGRELLRSRLTRRGITLAVMGTLLSAGTVEASVPAALQTATLKGAAAVVNKTTLAGTVSPSASALAGATGLPGGWVVIAALGSRSRRARSPATLPGNAWARGPGPCRASRNRFAAGDSTASF